MLKRLLPAVALAIGITQDLPAQCSMAAPAPDPAPARVDPSRVIPYHHSLRMVMTGANGQERQIGTLEDRVVLATDQGRPAIIRVQNIESPSGMMTDTAVADAVTLAPRWHSSHSAHRMLRLEFGQQRVRGTFKEAGDSSRTVDQPVADGVFDSNMLDVLIAALPLAAGYNGRLLAFLYEGGGDIPVDVTVTGSEKVRDVDTWVVNVSLGGRTARYYVDQQQHHTVQIVSSPASGAELRLVQ